MNNHPVSPAPLPLPSVLSVMQDLACTAHDLMDSYNRETQEAAAQVENAKKQAVAQLEQAQKQANTQLEQAQKQSATLTQMKEVVQKFLTEQEIAIHDKPSLPSSLPASQNHSDSAELCVQNAQHFQTQILAAIPRSLKQEKKERESEIEKTSYDGIGRLAAIVTFVASIWLTWSNRPMQFHGDGGALLWLFLLLGFPFIVAIATFSIVPAILKSIAFAGVANSVNSRRQSLTQSLREPYFSFLHETELAEKHLNAYPQQVQQQTQAIRHNENERLNQLRYSLQTSGEKLRHYLQTKGAKLQERCDNFSADLEAIGAAWWGESWKKENWQPFEVSQSCARVGLLQLLAQQPFPAFPEIKLDLFIPALVPFGAGRSLLFTAEGEEKQQAIRAAQSVMLRLLATNKPGRVRFMLIDPVGLGQNVADFMQLDEYAEGLITKKKAWSERQHIEARLAELTERIEEVIQKRLRNDYPDIEAYNATAAVPEHYQVLVVMDFPVNFSEEAARRLVSIARNGARCGVFTIVVCDTSKPPPYGFKLKDLRAASHVIHQDGNRFVWQDDDLQHAHEFGLDALPETAEVARFVQAVGEQATSGMTVEVSFEGLLASAHLTPDKFWHEDNTTAEKLEIPLGPKDAKKPQNLTMGVGTAHHAIVIGMPGSGKTNLMHVIISSLALKYSPDEMRVYLIDLKQGVGFKPYADSGLPHAEVIAIDSEREFGLSVLQGLDDEMPKRKEKFRPYSHVDNITAYRAAANAPMPRILLIIDEFQELFAEEDQIARQAGMLLDRLARQGRAFGIHIMLVSQSLGGKSVLSTSTLDQIGIRIALQCSEAAARQIMADNNLAARLLSRPGEAIYNDNLGLLENNSNFQVALLKDEDRTQRLRQINELARNSGKSYPSPIIFEGNQPARIENCALLTQALAANTWPRQTKSVDLWLGEPLALRPSTVVHLRPQGGNNLLIVTRDEQEGVGLMAASLLSLAAQKHPADAHFYIADFATPDTAWEKLMHNLAEKLPHEIKILNRRDFAKELPRLAAEAKRRAEDPQPNAPAHYLFIQGLHRARDLRPDEGGGYGRGVFDEPAKEQSPADAFATLLGEGADSGIHILAWCDTVANANRMIDRKLMREFSYRIAGQMSNEDSRALIEDAAASKIKPHRAVLYDEERPGYLEAFRPFDIPANDFVEYATAVLRSLNTA